MDLQHLVLQWMGDLSDRELERFLLREIMQENFFVAFLCLEKPPDHTYFSHLRAKIGTKQLAELFIDFNAQLKNHGPIAEVFNFVDASQIVSKVSL